MLLITVLISLFFWLFPDFGILRKGFDERQALFSLGGLFLLFWYSFYFAISFIAFKLGGTINISSSKVNSYLSLSNNKIYYILTFIATIGVFYTYLFILKNISIIGIYEVLMQGEGNLLKSLLYDDYEMGFSSLRYVAILSAAIAIFDSLVRKEVSFIFNLYNLVLLFMIVIISHRLALVFSIMIFLGLFLFNSKKNISLNINWLIFTVAIFIILMFLNSFRNIGFYSNYGINNPFLSGISEIVTYVGSPFQGGLSVGNNIDEFLNNNVMSSTDSSITGIENSLSTNSAILQLFVQYGVFLSFFVAFIAIMLTSFFMGMIYHYRHNYLLIVYLILLYPYAEFWRLFLFNRGIFFTLLIILIGTLILVRFLDGYKKF